MQYTSNCPASRRALRSAVAHRAQDAYSCQLRQIQNESTVRGVDSWKDVDTCQVAVTFVDTDGDKVEYRVNSTSGKLDCFVNGQLDCSGLTESNARTLSLIQS